MHNPRNLFVYSTAAIIIFLFVLSLSTCLIHHHHHTHKDEKDKQIFQGYLAFFLLVIRTGGEDETKGREKNQLPIIYAGKKNKKVCLIKTNIHYIILMILHTNIFNEENIVSLFFIHFFHSRNKLTISKLVLKVLEKKCFAYWTSETAKLIKKANY